MKNEKKKTNRNDVHELSKKKKKQWKIKAVLATFLPNAKQPLFNPRSESGCFTIFFCGEIRGKRLSLATDSVIPVQTRELVVPSSFWAATRAIMVCLNVRLSSLFV